MNDLPEKPLISVIMPVYNAGPYLAKAIESILNQSYPHFELLVCDDASTDDSLSIIKGFEDERIKLSINPENKGYLKTCNQLFKLAQGDIITFQDADDWSELNRLEMITQTFQQKTDIAFSLSHYNKVDESGKMIEKREVPFDTGEFGHNQDYWEYFCGATIAIKKEVLQKVGGYHEYFDRIGGEDYDWLFRIAQQFEGVQINKVLYNYRLHPSAVKKGNNWKKYYILDLINASRQLKLQEGEDYLAPKNSTWLQAKVAELEKPFKSDPAHLTKIEAISQLNSGKPKDALALASKAFKANPFNGMNFLFWVKINYWIFRRQTKL